jgi:NlpC/P60 family
MRGKGTLRPIASGRCVAALGLAWVCLIGLATTEAQIPDSTQKAASPTRLLTAEEGRSIMTAAWQQSSASWGTQDCSHLVHEIYRNAGFEYSYVSSTEMYAGNKSFARVKFPHAGDLIVWPGHMGIVVDPFKHSFYSLVTTGLEEQDYEAPYWRSRGRPRFYRYKVQNPIVLTATRMSASPISTNNKQHELTAVMDERSSEQASTSNRPPGTASERTVLIYGPPAPPERANGAPAPEIPSSIVIAPGSKPPTREEVAQGISTLNDIAGNVLRSDEPFQLPIVVVDSFNVERVEIKRDHGWVQLQIVSRVSIDGGTSQLKGPQEKIRWELRHTELGWEAVRPSNRAYVSHDAAVKNLAAQLARLTESDGAAAHQEAVLRQESLLANLLSALLGSNQEHF